MSKYSEDETLLDEEKQLLVAQWRREIDWHKLVSPVQRILPLWPWIGHVFLLSISSVMFFMSFLASTASPSDLVITQRVSAWCTFGFLPLAKTPVVHMTLTSPIAPVAPLVRYDTVRYNLTPIIHSSPYVGKGLDVDEAWEQISRGMHLLFIISHRLPFLFLGIACANTQPSRGHNDRRGGSPPPGLAVGLNKDHRPTDRRDRLQGRRRGLPPAALPQPDSAVYVARVLCRRRRGHLGRARGRQGSCR